MIARVFPRKTNATPEDDYAFVGYPPLFIPYDITEVHVSVVFTWDLPEAEKLADAWSRIAPVRIGGPATGMRGEEFAPGMYLKKGYTITSRGCANRCWFCSVWKREGDVRELPITEGWNVTDDNLLACSETHIKSVFKMLKNQKQRTQFTGGLEAKRLKSWHVEMLKDLKPEQMFFAFDTDDDWEPLEAAAELFAKAGYGTRSNLRCYVLVGFPGDTFSNADARLMAVIDLGICPMAMLYRDHKGETTADWRRFQRMWARPAAIYAKQRKEFSACV